MMQKYKDMRLFSLENGSGAEKTRLELAARRSSEAALPFPFQVNGHPAFIMYNGELAARLAAVHQKNAQLIRLCAKLPQNAIHQFSSACVVEEIQQSNEVENVHSTRQEIRDALRSLQDSKTNKRFTGMVRKYNMLIERKEIPLSSCTDVRALYNEFILDEVLRENPDNAPDGLIFRGGPVSVYSGRDQRLHEGLFPEAKIIEVMDKALCVQNNAEIDLLIRVAVFHFMFGYIHPFNDGNGRMARFISSYMLSQEYERPACLRIAYVIKAHRPAYYRLFKDADDKRCMGDLTRFVIDLIYFFEQALDDTLASLTDKMQRYLHGKAKLDAFCQKNLQAGENKFKIILDVMLEEELFGYPQFTTEGLAQLAGCNKRTVGRFLERCGRLTAHQTIAKKYWWHIDLNYLEGELENPDEAPPADRQA